MTVEEPSHSSSVPLPSVQEVGGEQVDQPGQRYPLRNHRPPVPCWACFDQSADASDPPDERAALSGPDANLWKHAIYEEMFSLLDNNTWSLVPLSADVKPLHVR